jgi:Zinc knuckle
MISSYTRTVFFMARYGKEKGVQGFYDALVDHAQNMAIYPDDYQIIKTFLKSLPSFMHELMFKDGLSPEINTIDDLVAQAIKHETGKKTLDYYNRMRTSKITVMLTPRTKPSEGDTRKTATKRIGAAYMKKSSGNKASKAHDPGHRPFLKPREPHLKPSNDPPPAPQEHKHNSKPNNGEHAHQHAPGQLCFNCNKLGHIAHNCPEKKKKKHKVQI